MATGQNIWDTALDYVDMTGSSFPDTTAGLRYLNAALAELHELLVSSPQSEYFHSESTITVVSGTEAYNLPSDFYRMKALYYVSSNRRFKVKRYNPISVDGYRNSPLTGGSLELWYVPYFTELTSLTESISTALQPQWQDYAALSVAVRLALREESFELAKMLAGERARKRAMIEAAIGPRDEQEPDSIGDYYERYESGRHLLDLAEKNFVYRIMGSQIFVIQTDYIGV